MAEKRSDSLAADQAEAAMNQVLQAEREAEVAIGECEHQAKTILNEAHERANRIMTTTDDRITRLKLRRTQWVAGEIRQRERLEKSAARDQVAELDESGLGECIEKVAALLTGGDKAP